MTSETLKTQIDSAITNKTATNSITPVNVGINMKAVVDYIDEQFPIDLSGVVHLTGLETISGSKTFTADTYVKNIYFADNSQGGYVRMQILDGGIRLVDPNFSTTTDINFPLTANYDYTFPSASGVLAIDTDLIHKTGDEIKSGTLTTTQYNLSALNTAPATATSIGLLGEIRIVDGYIYVCVATNTWKRTTLTTW